MKIYREKLAREIERGKDYIDRGGGKRRELFLDFHTNLWPNSCVIENLLLSWMSWVHTLLLLEATIHHILTVHKDLMQPFIFYTGEWIISLVIAK